MHGWLSGLGALRYKYDVSGRDVMFLFSNFNLEYVPIYTALFYVTLLNIYNASSSCTGLALRC